MHGFSSAVCWHPFFIIFAAIYQFKGIFWIGQVPIAAPKAADSTTTVLLAEQQP